MNLNLEELAGNINTPADKLYELAKSRNGVILAKIAQNPNCPPDLLISLFPDNPCDVLNNEILELILLEMPDFLEKLRQEASFCFSLYRLPDRLFEFTKYFSIELRREIVENPYIPICYLEKLIDDKDNYVRERAVKNLKERKDALDNPASASQEQVSQNFVIDLKSLLNRT